MNKKEKHRHDLETLLDEFQWTADAGQVYGYLTANSALPGPRANLELAAAFAEMVEHHAGREHSALWKLCPQMVQLTVDQAPVNSAEEFIPFCGTLGTAAIGSQVPACMTEALTALRELAVDPRWRIREAVAMGLQRLLGRHREHVLRELATWVLEGNLLEMRAVAAAVAEPGLLESQELALAALQLHRDIVDQIQRIEERRSGDFRVLRKALGYTLSVVTCALPEQGFALLAELVGQDRDLLWIARENLKKNRLLKHFPTKAEEMKVLLSKHKGG